jgi:hypothetical protein
MYDYVLGPTPSQESEQFNKMKNEKYHTLGTVLKSNRNTVEKE